MSAKHFQNTWRVITENADSTYLDFSVNINTLGIFKAVKENIQEITEIFS